MLTCCLPRSTKDDEPVYDDTYAQEEEDSNTEDRCSHRGAGPAHPPVHNVQGLLMTECKFYTQSFPGASVAQMRQIFDHQDEGGKRQPRRKPISGGRNQGQKNFVP